MNCSLCVCHGLSLLSTDFPNGLRVYSSIIFCYRSEARIKTETKVYEFTYFRERKYDIICLQETDIAKDVSEGWEKEWGGKLIYNECTYHSSGQVILFRNGVTIYEVNIVYNSRRIIMTKFEMVSNQNAVVNVYAPARSQEKEEKN